VVEFPTIVIGISVFLFFGLILNFGLSALTALVLSIIVLSIYLTVKLTLTRGEQS